MPKGGSVVCVCLACGCEFRRFPSDVRNGVNKYCSVRCVPKEVRQGTRTHGKSAHPLYTVWCSMKNRCSNPNFPMYAYYGGRGICVCTKWQGSFEEFFLWAVRAGWAPGLELDRADNDGDYSPGNCRWATRKQQMANTRKRRDAATSRFKGVSKHSQNNRWIAQIGINNRTVYIGSFVDEIEAARAYDKRAREVYGEYARTNFSQ